MTRIDDAAPIGSYGRGTDWLVPTGNDVGTCSPAARVVQPRSYQGDHGRWREAPDRSASAKSATSLFNPRRVLVAEVGRPEQIGVPLRRDQVDGTLCQDDDTSPMNDADGHLHAASHAYHVPRD